MLFVLAWYRLYALGSSFYLLSADQFIANHGKESSVYSKILIGSGVGSKGEEVEVYTARKWTRKESQKGGAGGGGVGRMETWVWSPLQTHIKRQLKKASSWCGKFQIYNNRALFVIGSICASGSQWEGEREGQQQGETGSSSAWLTERLGLGGWGLYTFFPLSRFLSALSGFKLFWGGNKSGMILNDWAKCIEYPW